jgi:glycine/D-amino acid oxidase-like deaminating enzyme
MNSAQLWKRFPAWNPNLFQDGILEIEAGYAKSGRAVATLVRYAESVGVELRSNSRFVRLDEGHDRVKGVVTRDGEQGRSGGASKNSPETKIAGDHVVMAVGAWTPYLLPFTKKFFRASGQPVFHLKPQQPDLFAPERFPVFGADITATGYYGFPLNRDGIVKIANHGPGREMSPESPERAVTPEDEQQLRTFLSWAFPALVQAPIVYTRVCMYCETHDGNFWIARDPGREGLVIAAGDCGHGFKFAPVLGEIIADVVEQKPNPISKKFRWRPEILAGTSTDAARFQGEHDRATQ